MTSKLKKQKVEKPDNKKIYCDIARCVGCKSCELACAVSHSKSKNVYGAVMERPAPVKRVYAQSIGTKIISLHCQHCADAPCITACMSGAMTKDEKTGATLQDMEKCVGCWMCVMVCPFGAITRDAGSRKAVKCDLCADIDGFACIEACPTKALFAGTEKEFQAELKRRLEQK